MIVARRPAANDHANDGAEIGTAVHALAGASGSATIRRRNLDREGRRAGGHDGHGRRVGGRDVRLLRLRCGWCIDGNLWLRFGCLLRLARTGVMVAGHWLSYRPALNWNRPLRLLDSRYDLCRPVSLSSAGQLHSDGRRLGQVSLKVGVERG
jgi:hypothetical protein